MFGKSSLFVQPTSGFVPFSGGGTLDPNLRDAEPMMLARHTTYDELTGLAAVTVEQHIGAWSPAVWSPIASARVRGVEMAVIAAVCAYFSMGLGKVLGIF